MTYRTTPTARKQHTCTACGHAIDKGERYERYEFAPWSPGESDDFGTWKLHEFCGRIVDRASQECDNEEGIEAGEAFENWRLMLWADHGLQDEYAIIERLDICTEPGSSIYKPDHLARMKKALGYRLDAYTGNILDVDAIRREVGV